MDESTFDQLAREEMADLETAFDDVDPDEVETATADGVLKLVLRDGVTVVINTQRPARQLWMAAVASAWHFDYDASDKRWRTKDGDELRGTLRAVVKERLGLDLEL